MRIKWALLVLLLGLFSPLLTHAQNIGTPCTKSPNVGFSVPVLGDTTNWGYCLNADVTMLDVLLGGNGVLTPANPVPTVNGKTTWITNNSTNTTITNFTNGFPGQTITIICGTSDTFTQMSPGTFLALASAWSCPTGQSISLKQIGAKWIETARAGGGSGGGGSGTVLGVAVNSFSPLFTATVASPTVNPVVTFSPVNAAANKVYANCGPLSGVPSFCSLTSAMIPLIPLATGVFGTLPHSLLPPLVSGDIPNNGASTSGNAATASALAGNPQQCGVGLSPSGILANGNATGCFSVAGLFSPGATGIIKLTVTPYTTGIAVAGTDYVAPSTTINGHALSSNVTISASDLTTGTLAHGQLPTLVSADIPNNAASTSGNAGTATALAAAGTSCSPGNYPLGIDVHGNALNCGPVSGSGNYQTIEVSGTAQTPRPTVNNIPGTNISINCVDNSGLSRTDCTWIASATSALAWSALTPSTNSTAGSYSFSGNTLDVSAGTLKITTSAGAVPTADGYIAVNATDHAFVHGSNGTTLVSAVAATGTNASTSCTNQVFTTISGIALPTCSSLTAAFLPATSVNAIGTQDANVTASIATQTLTLAWSGLLGVARGGSGVGTLTGPIKGNGTGPYSAAVLSDFTSMGLVPNTITINGHALSSNVVISASDLTTGTLPHPQLPVLVSADIPNNAASTTGNAATATALQNTPTLCPTGQAPTGILPNGNAQGCAASSGGSPPAAPTNALQKYLGPTTFGASSLLDSGAALSTTEPLNAASLSTGTSPPTICTGLTGCIAMSEGGTAVTPTAGVESIRADSTAHGFLCSANGVGEIPCAIYVGTANEVTVAAGAIALASNLILPGTIALNGAIDCSQTWTNGVGQLTTIGFDIYADCYTGSGANDIGDKVNTAAASAQCPANGCVIHFAQTSYNNATPIVFNTNLDCPTLRGYPANGTTINWTPTSGTLITYNCMQSHHPGWGVFNMALVAASCGSNTSVGIALGGSHGGEQFNLQGSWVQDFNQDILYGSNTWATHFVDDHITETCGVGKTLDYPTTTTNAGESSHFDGVYFTGSNSGNTLDATCITLDGGGQANFVFTASSFDDCNFEMGGAGIVVLEASHFENPGSTNGNGAAGTCSPFTGTFLQVNGGRVLTIGTDYHDDCTAGTGPAKLTAVTNNGNLGMVFPSFFSGSSSRGVLPSSIDNVSASLTLVGIMGTAGMASSALTVQALGQLNVIASPSVGSNLNQLTGFLQVRGGYVSATGMNQAHRNAGSPITKNDFFVTCGATETDELPAAPVDGQIIYYTNNGTGQTCTLDGNGNNIGAGTQLVLTGPFSSALVYFNTTLTTWEIVNPFGTQGSPLSIVYTGTASQPSLSVLGVPFAGTGTTSFPQVLLSNTSATAPTTWSANGTYLGINAASTFTGNYWDFHNNGGVSISSMTYTGALTVASCSGCTPNTYALLASPAFTGTPTAPTASVGTNTTQVATMAAIAAAMPTVAAVSHEWLNSYTASTGAWTQTQPATTDLSDIATFALNTSGAATFSKNGAASVAGVLLSGTPDTGGTNTTTFPLLYLNNGTAPSSWSTGGTYLGINSNGSVTNCVDIHANGGASLFRVSCSGAETSASTSSATQFISTVATGTAPLNISSTTPVPTLTVSNHPKAQYCGTTSTCGATAETGTQIVYGSAALVTGTPSAVTITGISPAFTSSSTYQCTFNDQTGVATSLYKFTPVSGSSFTITGGTALTDTVGYICVGN